MYALCTPCICVCIMFGYRLSVRSSLVEIHSSVFVITEHYFLCAIVIIESEKELKDIV